jgi:hypothetical protein
VDLLAEVASTRIAAIENYAHAQVALMVRRLEQRLIEATSTEGDWRLALFRNPRTCCSRWKPRAPRCSRGRDPDHGRGAVHARAARAANGSTRSHRQRTPIRPLLRRWQGAPDRWLR